MEPLFNREGDDGQTHYYGDGCDDPHGKPGAGDQPLPNTPDCPEGMVESGSIWNCSSRCWWEGGPHDETCRETILYRKRNADGN